MSQHHPITPPTELVQQWINEEDGLTAGHIAAQAAQWGADQELEACEEWVADKISVPEAAELRFARRPKPPSLKEQALARLTSLEKLVEAMGHCPDDTIRRALEALPND